MPDRDNTPVSERVYAAAKAHATCRGVDLTDWPNQQALVPDEVRWMRAALDAAGYPAEVGRLREALDRIADVIVIDPICREYASILLLQGIAREALDA